MCHAPACHSTVRGCQCPNPWLEFLSKNARDKGKQSMAQHKQAYAATKAAGAFVPRAGLRNGSCRSDPIKLCTWMAQRKAPALRGVQGVLSSALERRMLRRLADLARFRPGGGELDAPRQLLLVREFLIQKINLPPRIINALSLKDALGKLHRHTCMPSRPGPPGTSVAELDSVLAKGAYGLVLRGRMTPTTRDASGRPCVVKLVGIGRCSSARSAHQLETSGEFYLEINMQRWVQDHMAAQLRRFGAPTIRDAWIVDDVYVKHAMRVGCKVGVVVMDPLDGTLHSVLHRHERALSQAPDGGQRTRATFLTQLAKHLKELVEGLERANVTHGDLHTGNVGLKQSARPGGLPTLCLLDFGRALPLKVSTDRYWVWRNSMDTHTPAAFNEALHRVGFPPPIIYNKGNVSTVTVAAPRRGDAADEARWRRLEPEATKGVLWMQAQVQAAVMKGMPEHMRATDRHLRNENGNLPPCRLVPAPAAPAPA